MGRMDNKLAIVTGANSSRRSKDMELAKRLYEFSEQLVSG